MTDLFLEPTKISIIRGRFYIIWMQSSIQPIGQTQAQIVLSENWFVKETA